MMIIPYTSAARLSRMASISSYSFSAVDKDKVDEPKASIERYLLSVFNDSNYYSVYNQAD